MTFELHSIGHVRSPYRERKDAPRQGQLADAVSEIIIDPPYRAGLFRLEEMKHLFVLCWFDRAEWTTLRAIPPHNPVEHGVFATRSPNRPNPVVISIVALLEMDGGVLRVRGLDALDGTPVIDIKPYVPEIDALSED